MALLTCVAQKAFPPAAARTDEGEITLLLSFPSRILAHNARLKV